MLFCNFKHIDIIVLDLFFVMVFADRSFSVQIYSERELFQLVTRYARKNSSQIKIHCFTAIYLPASIQFMRVSRHLSKSYVVSNLQIKE